jgi:hypothetical protein
VNSNGTHVFLNNTFYDVGNGAIALYNASGANCVHVNNLIQGFSTGHYTSHATNSARRNVFYNNLTHDTTTVYGTATDPTTWYDAGDITGDPSLNTTTFAIDSDSPAFEAGQNFRTS